MDNSSAEKAELEDGKKIEPHQPKDSVLVLTDLRDTNVGSNLLPAMNATSDAAKDDVKKTAVLGVSGVKRQLAGLLKAMSGQPLKHFDEREADKSWLVEEDQGKSSETVFLGALYYSRCYNHSINYRWEMNHD